MARDESERYLYHEVCYLSGPGLIRCPDENIFIETQVECPIWVIIERGRNQGAVQFRSSFDQLAWHLRHNGWSAPAPLHIQTVLQDVIQRRERLPQPLPGDFSIELSPHVSALARLSGLASVPPTPNETAAPGAGSTPAPCAPSIAPVDVIGKRRRVAVEKLERWLDSESR